MKTKRTKACAVEALFRTLFCTKTSTRFCTECGLALRPEKHPNGPYSPKGKMAAAYPPVV